jgi:hypothetical protein
MPRQLSGRHFDLKPNCCEPVSQSVEDRIGVAITEQEKKCQLTVPFRLIAYLQMQEAEFLLCQIRYNVGYGICVLVASSETEEGRSTLRG